MEPAIRTERLTKRFGRVQALDQLDLRVEPGEIFGFLGPNGAGKSTTIRILLDLIRPTAGHAAIFGHDCQGESLAARAMVGYLPSDPAFPPKQTADDVLTYADALRGGTTDAAYRDRLIRRLQLDVTRRVSTLSRGNRQKVGLIRALLPRPPLVILDEPTTGLDPLIQEEVEAILREVAAEGRTVFFSSHILAEVETICSRAAIVREGRLVDVFNLAEQRRLAPVHVEVTFAEAPPAEAYAAFPPGIRVLSHEGVRAAFEVHDGLDPLIRWLAQRSVAGLNVRQQTLEELFLRHYRTDATGHSGGPA